MKTRNLIAAVCGTILKIVVAILAVMVIYRGAILAYDYGYRVFAEKPMTEEAGQPVLVTITEDMTPLEMGELLYQKGLVRDARLFSLQYYLSEYRKDVTPGQYELNTAMTAEEMLGAMAASKEEDKVQEGNSKIGGGTTEEETTDSSTEETDTESQEGEEDSKESGSE